MAEESQKKTVVIVIVLAVALGGVLVLQSGMLSASDKGSQGAPSTDGEAEKAPAGAKLSAEKVAAKLAKQWPLPDPVELLERDPMFIPKPTKPVTPVVKVDTPAEVVVTRPDLRVSGIFHNPDQASSVIIEGRILHEGDSIRGATVVRISEQTVAFRWQDENWEVAVGQGSSPTQENTKS